MKKVLLLFISIVFLSNILKQPAYAYQTVLVDFPLNQGWHSVYYDTQAGETILQYVPIGETNENWTRAVIFHAYKNLTWTNSAAGLLDKLTQQMELKNSSQLYKYTKYTREDSIATRCVQKNAYMPAQCDIFRAAKGFDGLITMDYINKNVTDFKKNYNMWYDIIQGVRIYYSYYMDDRILDKATSFEM